jgi:hypothetical protein
MPFNHNSGSPRQAANRINSPSPEPGHSGGDGGAEPEPGEQHKGFISSHFGNPEQVHVYGAGNDYESEEEVKEEEKAAGGQFIWYVGALALILFICYWLFGLRR